MIKQCNFKNDESLFGKSKYKCALKVDVNMGISNNESCDGEENCILYQNYKISQKG